MRDCAAEALPVAETAEAEQGQRSVFCEGVATPEAKAGYRNRAAAGGGEGQNGEGEKNSKMMEKHKYTNPTPPLTPKRTPSSWRETGGEDRK